MKKLFDFIIKKNKIIHDDFFGDMLFYEFKETPEKNYFECQKYFSPIHKDIEIGIDSDIAGPKQVQKNFFINIEEKYFNVMEKIEPVIEIKFRQWKKDFEINRFMKDLIPIYLYIPRCEDNPIRWEIGFKSTIVPIYVTVKMVDDKPENIIVDS